MSLTITEASDVNTVAGWLLGLPRNSSETTRSTEYEVRSALARLAGKAHKTLMAGVTVDQITGPFAVEPIDVPGSARIP